MQPAPTPLFDLPPMRHLLDAEWAYCVRESVRLAAGPALSITTGGAGGARALLPGRPGSVELQVDGDRLGGEASCTADALPWAAASFDLVIVRHATDLLPGCGLERELARVLAPGGSLLLFGLNPWSLWRWWWSRQALATTSRPRPVGAARMRDRLDVLGLEASPAQGFGGAWPGVQVPAAAPARAAAGWQAAWMLRADKRALAVRPLPLRTAIGRARRIAPALAPRASLRECA